MALARGQRVAHPGFGPGTVKAVIDGGRRVRVEFDRFPGIPYTLPAAQFEPVGDITAPAGTKKKKATRQQKTTPKTKKAGTSTARRGAPRPVVDDVDRVDHVDTGARRPLGSSTSSTPSTPERAASFAASARQLFEALRMGVVPPALLDRYTVGRDEEIRRLRAFIEGRRGLLVIEGHYGTGKTHLIELATSEACQAGYVTSRVSFDAVEVPPSNPLRVYRELVAGLRYPPGGIAGGLTPVFSRLLRSRVHRQTGTASFHRYLSPALFALAEGSAEASEAALAFVEGRGGSNADEVQHELRLCGWSGPRMLALPDWRTFGQVFLYLVGGIAVWARDAGFAGLAVFFDEAEALDSLERTSRELAETVLRYFAAATLPEDTLPFDVGRLYRGGQSVHRSLPHLFRADQPLLACFAFTPLPEVSTAIEAAGVRGKHLLEIEGPTAAHLPRLAERLVALHRELHPDHRLDAGHVTRLVEHIERGLRAGVLSTTRSVTRLAVEYLDVARHLPERASDALEDI